MAQVGGIRRSRRAEVVQVDALLVLRVGPLLVRCAHLRLARHGVANARLILSYSWINTAPTSQCHSSKKQGLLPPKDLTPVAVLNDGFENYRGFTVGELCESDCGSVIWSLQTIHLDIV